MRHLAINFGIKTKLLFLLSIDIRQVIDLVKDPKGPKVTRPDMKVLSDPSLPVEVPDYVKGEHDVQGVK